MEEPATKKRGRPLGSTKKPKDEAMTEDDSSPRPKKNPTPKNTAKPLKASSEDHTTPSKKGRPKRTHNLEVEDGSSLPELINDLATWRSCLAALGHNPTVDLAMEREEGDALLGAGKKKKVRNSRLVETASRFQYPPPDLLLLSSPSLDSQSKLELEIGFPKAIAALSKPLTKTVLLNGQELRVERFCSVGRLTLLNVGEGGVSAMAFSPPLPEEAVQMLAVAPLAEGDQLQPFSSPPSDLPYRIAVYRMDTKDLLYELDVSAFGMVQQLAWEDASFMAAVFGDGSLRIFRLPSLPGSYGLDEDTSLLVHRANATALAWRDNLLAVGTGDGHVLLYRISPLTMIAGRRINPQKRQPVVTLAFSPTEPFLIAVGLFDSPSVLLDLSSSASLNIACSLSWTPIVRWAPSPLHAIFTCDQEGGVRCFPEDHLLSTLSQQSFPMATHRGCAANDVAFSDFHNVVATVSADGSLHLSWLRPLSHLLLMEKRILQWRRSSDIGQLTETLEIPKSAKGGVLPPPCDSLTLVRWSRHQSTPGLLAGTPFGIGLVFLVCLDRLLI